jgi:hypothetical protein
MLLSVGKRAGIDVDALGGANRLQNSSVVSIAFFFPEQHVDSRVGASGRLNS